MIESAVYCIMGILLLALILTIIRLVKGPSTPDRIVSLDMIGSILIGMVLCLGIVKDNKVYIDVVLIITLILFVGTVAMSKYLTKNANKNGNSNHDNINAG